MAQNSKSKRNSNSINQNFFTWSAFIVSLIALFTSVWSVWETRETRLATTKDQIQVQARRPFGNELISTTKNQTFPFGILIVPWDIVISNIGNSTVSITDYEVSQQNTSDKIDYYSDLNHGLTSADTNESITLPITLEAGKSMHFKLLIGIKLGENANRIVSKIPNTKNKPISIHAIEHELATNKIDIYDNPVTTFGTDKIIAGWRVENTDKNQIFNFQFKTARGYSTQAYSSWYNF